MNKLLSISEHYNSPNNIGYCGYNTVIKNYEKYIKQNTDTEIHHIVFNREVRQQPNNKQDILIPSDKICNYLKENDYLSFYGHYFDRSAEYKIRESCNVHVPIISFAHDLVNSYLQIKNMVLDFPHTSYDAIIVPTNSGKEVINNYMDYIYDRYKVRYLGDVEVIPYGVDMEKFEAISKQAAKKILNFSMCNRYILSVGRFSKLYKTNLDPILSVFQKISNIKEFSDVKLVLAGSIKDNYFYEIKNIIKTLNIQDKVILYPNFKDENKHIIFKSADIFLSISDHPQETFGIAPLEAMASNLPVILSDWNGYKELVIDDYNGYKIPIVTNKKTLDDPNVDMIGGYSIASTIDLGGLYNKLILLLKNTNKREDMGKNSYEFVKKYFTWDIVVDKLINYLLYRKNNSLTYHKIHKVEKPLVSEIFKHYPTKMK